MPTPDAIASNSASTGPSPDAVRSSSAIPRATRTVATGLRSVPVVTANRTSSQVRGKTTNCSSTSAMTSSCRSEEHTSELQSLTNLVCRLLLEKKKKKQKVDRYKNV